MGLEIGQITIDCADPQRMAEFWSAALADPEGNQFCVGECPELQVRPVGGPRDDGVRRRGRRECVRVDDGGQVGPQPAGELSLLLDVPAAPPGPGLDALASYVVRAVEDQVVNVAAPGPAR